MELIFRTAVGCESGSTRHAGENLAARGLKGRGSQAAGRIFSNWQLEYSFNAFAGIFDPSSGKGGHNSHRPSGLGSRQPRGASGSSALLRSSWNLSVQKFFKVVGPVFGWRAGARKQKLAVALSSPETARSTKHQPQEGPAFMGDVRCSGVGDAGRSGEALAGQPFTEAYSKWSYA